jgi:hypothetical protein
MQAREWYFEDKTSWGLGPWQDEPDKAQWVDPDTGLPCLMVRNQLGALCGYVGVDDSHPWHGKSYSAPVKGSCTEWCTDDYHDGHTPEGRVTVHGGLTFAAACAGDPETHSICHVAGPGEPEPLWWFGFDCAHLGDMVPAMAARERERGLSPIPSPFGDYYKDLGYVKAECSRLAKQLAEVALSE